MRARKASAHSRKRRLRIIYVAAESYTYYRDGKLGSWPAEPFEVDTLIVPPERVTAFTQGYRKDEIKAKQYAERVHYLQEK